MQKKLINDVSSFVSAIITLIIVFLLTFLSIFGILSLSEYNKETENKNQIIVYLNDLDVDEKKEFSKKLLELPGVSSVRYESKELALKAVMIELGITLPENENPLDDAFYVYLNKDVNLDNLKENLVNMKEINIFDFRTKAIEKGINFNRNIERFTLNVTVVMLLFTVFMIYNIIKFSIISKKKEIHETLEAGVEEKEVKKIFFLENLFSIVIAFFGSVLIYLYIKMSLVESIKLIVSNYTSTIPFITEVLSLLGVLVLTILISAFINYIFMNKYFKDSKTCNESKDIEIVENLEEVQENLEDKGVEDEK